MDDSEVDCSTRTSVHDSSSSYQGLASVDSFLDELLNATTCTHTHTCNLPGPDAAHTHTCVHTHTRVIASEEDDGLNSKEDSNSKAKRPTGNREAVRKYREKKKAPTAYLEEEVKKLQLQNQQLVRKLQGQALLEAEVLRLQSLLVDLRSKLDGALSNYPLQNQCSTATITKEGNCGSGAIGLECETELPCFVPQSETLLQDCAGGNTKFIVSLVGNCQPAIINCPTAHQLGNVEVHNSAALLSSAKTQ